MAAKKRSVRTSRRPPAKTRRPARRASKGPSKKKRATAKKAAAFVPLQGAEVREVGHVRLEVVRAGAARVKRMTYPAGFHWAVDMKPITGTDHCMHGHVGFLVQGEVHIEYPDGCVKEFKAPAVVVIEPGHDGWVVGRRPAVLVEFDFERETIQRLGLPDSHRHGGN